MNGPLMHPCLPTLCRYAEKSRERSVAMPNPESPIRNSKNRLPRRLLAVMRRLIGRTVGGEADAARRRDYSRPGGSAR